ncbi:MAG: HIT domain-containing protein [Planctomycetota bacterium]
MPPPNDQQQEDQQQEDRRPNARDTDRLSAPWRLRYLETLDAAEKRAAHAKSKPDTGCFLRDYWLTPEDDASNHVIVREPAATSSGDGSETERGPETDGGGMILLNAYPYSNGHLLVALAQSRPRLLDYTPDERALLWSLVDRAAALMERALEPHGINIGVNQGRAAGAGVPQHLHAHLVPRWGGDVNFMTVVGQVRVVPSSLEDMYQRYVAARDA